MADETDATVNADAATNADAPAAVEAPVAPKKPRRPRMKKGSPEMTADVEVDVERAPGQKRRGRKPKAAGEAAVAKRAPTKSVTKSEQKAVEATSAGDDMADLLQLEEENQRLRKLLAERLRAENADLRKKLKLA
ncbi:hypothetical protein ABID21_004633 [Pseudorhizobium tarimense]|uniref:SyrB-like regulator n=2 Tax=Pseudorhizobium tarimense TaxID=1079109 RepID=A0ABV2HDM6_9HYPH